jgi:glycosyltransferase involved in cell wall biosynthesis
MSNRKLIAGTRYLIPGKLGTWNLELCILSWGFDPERQGGIARFCIELAIGFRRLGMDVELWGLLAQATAREQRERQRLHAMGVQTHAVPPYRGEPQTALTAMITTVLHVRHAHLQYVSVHGALAELCGLAIAANSHVPVIRTIHSEREWYKRPRLGRLVDHAYARWGLGEIGVSSHITAMINERRRRAAAHTLARWIPPISNQVVIEQAASITQAEARARLDIPVDAYVIGSVGRFTIQKGYDVLVEAVALLRDAGTDLQVYIVGEGPLEAQLRGQIVRLQLQSRVHLLAPRADIGYFLRALDLSVSCSRWEGMSASIHEAALCGLPIVCTTVSGTDDLQRVIDDPLLTCPPDDPHALAQQILAAKWKAKNHEPKTTFGQVFTHEAIAQAYVDYFETTIRYDPKSKI